MCMRAADIAVKNDTGSDISIPPGCHMIKIGCFLPIDQMPCNQDKMKSRQIDAVLHSTFYVGCNLYKWGEYLPSSTKNSANFSITFSKKREDEVPPHPHKVSGK